VAMCLLICFLETAHVLQYCMRKNT
jgi:hypothetical protein